MRREHGRVVCHGHLSAARDTRNVVDVEMATGHGIAHDGIPVLRFVDEAETAVVRKDRRLWHLLTVEVRHVRVVQERVGRVVLLAVMLHVLWFLMRRATVLVLVLVAARPQLVIVSDASGVLLLALVTIPSICKSSHVLRGERIARHVVRDVRQVQLVV